MEIDRIHKASENLLNELHPDQWETYESGKEENTWLSAELVQNRTETCG